MLKMQLKEGTRVVTSDGKEVGKVNRFVIDPLTDKVTHIVVQKGGLFAEDKVVPLDKVNLADEHDIVLKAGINDFNDFPPFEETHFVQAAGQDVIDPTPDDPPHLRVVPAYYWYPPAGYMEVPGSGIGYENWPQMETKQNIPEETVALKEGSKVVSSDGRHVGNVERLLLDRESKRATHFSDLAGNALQGPKTCPGALGEIVGRG
ncbi:MAG: PRC-barrel domain-containing protein [Anaerolineales bacterium]